MIGRIAGKLVEKKPPQVVIDVHGVGYEIDVPMSTFYNLPQTGGDVTLFTHLAVREDAHLLYGFGTESERQVFRRLLRISGVGAKTALGLLSGLSVADLQHAVATQDSGRLVKIPGIGRKTAERLLLELRDKLDLDGVTVVPGATPAAAGNDVVHALLALGYNEKEAGWALKQLEPGLPVSDAIRQSLRLLSKA
jgi:Holliday junction DNA helicase RuvA